MIEIPINPDLSWQSITVEIDENRYRLTLAWNTREERWYMDVAEDDGTELVSGVPLVVDFPLLERFASRELPDGFLMASDTTGAGREIEQMEDLGDRVKLVFILSDEI